MRVIDKDGNTLENPDLSLGRLEPDRLVSAHHDAIPAADGRDGIGHYQTVETYPNGGKDLEWVWDEEPVPPALAQDAWDEYEDVMRYVPYTEEELAQIEAEKNRPTVESLAAENKRLAAQLEASIESNAMLEDCLAEMAEIVYA